LIGQRNALLSSPIGHSLSF